MKNKEIIDRLESIDWFLQRQNDYSERDHEALSLAVKFLKLVSKPLFLAHSDGTIEPIRVNDEWIPVSERAPEKNGWFITTCEDICKRNVHTVFYDAKYKKWGRGGVIAWRPLPEPYKEADDEFV